MKLNFWQWIAIGLLIVGLAWWHFDTKKAANSTVPSGNAATMPTTVP